ncbi:MAG TPA: hypothetical protein VK177_17765 [Flavobacteriales bacterium]|nr:hypothetical protein [Flavobacteriales bacterium]
MKETFKICSVALALSAGIVACGDSKTGGDDPGVTTVDTNVTTGPIIVNGKIFSIPSPFQTATLIKNSGAAYNSQLLNPVGNKDNYSTNFHKALNLGIYGADMGYMTMYEKTDDAPALIAAVQKMADDLGMGGAFSREMIDRFTNNLENKDSLMVLVADAYTEGDRFLKSNDKNDMAGLILAGGWIEALYFSTSVALERPNSDIIDRIGQQKATLDNLIQLLEEYGNDESYSNLANELKDLYSEFENVQTNYVFNEPEVNADKNLTVIKSKTTVTLTDENLKAISEKIKNIRQQIVEASL